MPRGIFRDRAINPQPGKNTLRGRNRIKHNWVELAHELRQARKKNDGLTLYNWCLSKGINYQMASKEISEVNRMEAGEILNIETPKAARKLAALMDSTDEAISGKMSTAILDRSGFSPQAVAISVQANALANAQSQVVIPPLFSSDDQEAFKKLLGADEN